MKYVRRLLDAKADPNSLNEEGATPLHLAAREHFKILDYLAKYIAKIFQQNEKCLTNILDIIMTLTFLELKMHFGNSRIV